MAPTKTIKAPRKSTGGKRGPRGHLGPDGKEAEMANNGAHPKYILGWLWKRYTNEMLQRILQAHECLWSKKDKKVDLLKKLADLARLKSLGPSDRTDVLDGGLQTYMPWRYQEVEDEYVNDEGELVTELKPTSFPPIIREMLDEIRRTREEVSRVAGAGTGATRGSDMMQTEDDDMRVCQKCHHLRSEFAYPNQVSEGCSHDSTWCRGCLATGLRKQIMASDTEELQCPMCMLEMTGKEVKDIVKKSDYEIFQVRFRGATDFRCPPTVQRPMTPIRGFQGPVAPISPVSPTQDIHHAPIIDHSDGLFFGKN